jgi:hypothetical protein
LAEENCQCLPHKNSLPATSLSLPTLPTSIILPTIVIQIRRI